MVYKLFLLLILPLSLGYQALLRLAAQTLRTMFVPGLKTLLPDMNSPPLGQRKQVKSQFLEQCRPELISTRTIKDNEPLMNVR